MSEAYDWSWVKDAAVAPEITLDLYLTMPEELCRRVEVEDGRIIYCESASPNHQRIARNLIMSLVDVTEKHDRSERSCHEVLGDVDVLFSEVPRFNYRKPDVVVYRCVPKDRRGKWGDKPTAGDVVIAVEVVSPGTKTEDLNTKRQLYAKAGIPHYWIVRMAGDDGLAATIERFVLTPDGEYASAGAALRDKHLYAVNTSDPFGITVTWEQLDRGFPIP